MRGQGWKRTCVASGLLAASCTPSAGPLLPSLVPPHLTLGVAIGEVQATSAVAWGRCDRATALHVQLDDTAPRSAAVTAAHDWIGKVVLADLRAGTAYRYRAWCGAAVEAALAGEFQTAPAAGDAVPVRLIWGGDVGGQNVCRDAVEGYPIFARMNDRHPDVFIALGDMVYADDACSAVGRFGNRQVVGPGLAGVTIPAFWEHWRYNRADPATQRFFATTPYYSVWDDHEIQNDAGPPDPASQRRLPMLRETLRKLGGS